MINNIKFLLEIYKDNKKQIMKLKLWFFLFINIIFFIYIFMELNNPILFNQVNIQSNLLEKGITIFYPFFKYMGLNIVQCKLMLIFMFVIILNIIIIYFSMVLFVGFLIYLAKLWYKIQTNILINHENMKILDIKFQYILNEREKKDILDTYILNNNIKIDIEMYNKIWDSITLLNDKLLIYNEIKIQITDYLTKIHLGAQTNTFSNSIIDFTEFLNKLDTVGIIKGVLIIGAVIIGIYFAHSLFISSVSTSKDMSEAVLDANKTNTESTINTFKEMRKQMDSLNENNSLMHENTLAIEKNIGIRFSNVETQIDGLKNGLTKTAEWNDKITENLNNLNQNFEITKKMNNDAFSEIKNLIVEDSMTAQTILELKKNIEVHKNQISVLLRMTNYFHSYIIRSGRSNTPPIDIDKNVD